MTTHKVKLYAPKREQWPSCWAIQREFVPGIHDVEVDDKQLAELRDDAVVKLVEVDGKPVAGEAMPTPPQPPPTETKPTPKMLKTNR